MIHSPIFRNLAQAIRITLYCENHQLSTSQGLEQLAALQARIARWPTNKRDRLIHAARRSLRPTAKQRARAQTMAKNVQVGIVGAGLAGLACGYELKKKGIFATLYEASTRVGGRCFSLGGSFPGPVNFPNQVVERGGEFIDSRHQTMIGYANQFHLTLEDVLATPGGISCYFNGQHYSEAAIVDECRDLLAVMGADLRKLSAAPTADNHTDADVLLDNISLLEYLETRQTGELVKAAINASYVTEYGLELQQQSCLNFLLEVRAAKRSMLNPFYFASDECYRIFGGNEQIVQGLGNELQGQIHLGMRLLRVRQNSLNRIELTFKNDSKTISVDYDAVVLAIPFPALRQVELDENLELPAWKLEAINKLNNGTSAKMMLGFNSRPWTNLGSNGMSYSDLPNHQLTWQVHQSRSSNTHTVLVDYSGGKRGAKLNPNNVQAEATHFLKNVEQIYPGAIASAFRDIRGNLLVHLEHWPSNPFVQGSYACYQPGQFTVIAGNEGKQIHNLYFAGEHTNSYYEWQGYMEGAALSGLRAAREIFQHFQLNAKQYYKY